MRREAGRGCSKAGRSIRQFPFIEKVKAGQLMNQTTLATASAVVGAMSLCFSLSAAAGDASDGVVASASAPAAIGPYSQAILANGTLYVSGQLGLDVKTGELAGADTGAQAQQILKNLAAILLAGGMVFDDVVMAQIYLIDLADYALVNKLYGEVFQRLPARAVVQVARLPRDARIEISVIATKAERR